MYTRPIEPTHRVDREALRQASPMVRDANLAAFKAGLQLRRDRRAVRPPLRGQARARCAPGTYRNITGNIALAYGLDRRRPAGEAAAVPRRRTRSRRRPTSSTSCRSTRTSACAPCRPRTRSPASAPRSAPRSPATSASPTTSGPGVDLKSEAIGLAVSLELPLLIIDVQRGGPSTGLPTKTEQADLLLAMYGRHGEAPLPIVAATVAGALLRRRVRGGPHRAEVPHAGDPADRRLPRQRRRAVAAARRRRAARHLASPFADRAQPRRDAASGRTCAIPRRWPARGRSRARPASMHRIGGIEKEDGTGNISYDPDNHERMVAPAGREGRRHRQRHPARSRSTTTDGAEVLVLGWGRTWGAISAGRAPGAGPGPARSAHAHLVHLNPFPRQPRRGAAPLPARCSCPR